MPTGIRKSHEKTPNFFSTTRKEKKEHLGFPWCLCLLWGQRRGWRRSALLESNVISLRCQKTSQRNHFFICSHSFIPSSGRYLGAIYFMPGSRLGPADSVEKEVDMVSALIKIPVLVGE